MKLNSVRFASAVAHVWAIAGLICGLTYIAAPQSYARAANFLLHSDMFTSTRGFGWGELVAATGAWWGLAFVLAGASASLYNRSVASPDTNGDTRPGGRKMKRTLVLAMTVLFGVATSAVAQGKHGHQHTDKKNPPITLTGEVLDLTCFMQHPDNAVGPEHAKCAKACINKGLPIGFRAEDGTIYLLIGADHEPIAEKLTAAAGKKSTVTGTVIDHDGVKAIALVSIADAKP
jgi:hypothetical protein